MTGAKLAPAQMYESEIETLSRKDLAEMQLDRLKRLVVHAHDNVEHYQKSFAAVGVKPSDLSNLDDLKNFPFTVKDDLRAAYPFGLFAVPRDEVNRVHASSGSTGKPTVVGYTKNDLDIWDDLMARSMMAQGARPGEIFHNAYGYGLFTGGLGFHGGATRLGLTVVPMSGGNTERQIQLITDFGASILGATPSYALRIAEVAEAEGANLREGNLRIGCFGAEPWTAAMRVELEARLGIRAMDIYGLSEIIGPGVASECLEAQDGLHGWEDHFLFEIIDPETGEPLPMGQTGELVITTLTKQALPMIRYRTRDITRLNNEPCVCGRTHLRIEKISGRNDDMLIIRGVNVYPSQIEAVLVGRAGIAPHYQLVVTRDGNMDALRVEVEAAADIEEDADKYSAIGNDVVHHIKAMVGVTCSVEVKRPGAVPRSQGKAVRVRDMRKG